MIFPAASGAAETLEVRETAAGASLAFDCKKKHFELVDGGPRVISGEAAIRQWIELLVRTIPGRYAIYGNEPFGVDTTDLVGKKRLPSGEALSEIRRQVEDGAALCPPIRSVYGFGLEGSALTFTVELEDGEEVMTIEL